MVRVLFSPGEVFASVERQVTHKDWVVPLIIVAIVSLISMQFLMPVIHAETADQLRARLEQREGMTEEQIESTLETMTKASTITTTVGAPVGAAVWLIIQAGLLLLLANFILGGHGTFKKVLAVTSYTSLVAIPTAIVTVPFVLAKGSVQVQIGLGLFLPASVDQGFLFHFLNSVNFFSIWQYGLIAIGLAAVAGVSTKRAAYGAYALYLVLMLAMGALRSLSGGLAG
jgi:hypothetical protein